MQPPPKPPKPEAVTLTPILEAIKGVGETKKRAPPPVKQPETRELATTTPPPLASPQPNGDINLYHKTHFGDEWLYLTFLFHGIQFSLLLSVGYDALTSLQLAVLVTIVCIVGGLLVVARKLTDKLPASLNYNYTAVRTPEQETDVVPNSVIFFLSAAAILEGAAFAIYPTASAGHDSNELNESGFKSSGTMVQILSFASITLYGFHRIIRPANRVDPLRTVLELEAVSVCWDALDGASLYELITETDLSPASDFSARFLMCFWYISVGLRLALLYCAHLSGESDVYKFLLPPALSLSPEPTVDRTLQAINLRSVITMLMGFAEFYAAGLRINLWRMDKLSSLQQEMMIKNILYLFSVGSAMNMLLLTKFRSWNQRELFMDFKKPERSTQIVILRWLFVATYLTVGAVFSAFLTKVTDESAMWVCNVGTDIILCLAFLYVFRNLHRQKVWVIFPLKWGCLMGVLLTINLFIARIPAMYSHVEDMDPEGSDSTWTYTNALFIVLASIVPISCYALFFSVSYMMFHAEFTACPGNYNAIHDPATILVSVQTMVEGALDIVSCSSLLSLAMEGLPDDVNGFIVLFSFCEIANACQGFALQVLLSGGHDDTPGDLVKWRAKLRVGRGLMDLGSFLLRLVLWIKFNAVSSVFLIKNLYNIIHTIALIERAAGTNCYPKDTMFLHFVHPRDWYGLSAAEWRKATSETITLQAQSGRAV